MPAIKLTIVFYPETDKVAVGGPIEQKTLAYGMLIRAQEEIALYHAKKANGSPVVLAGAAVLSDGRN